MANILTKQELLQAHDDQMLYTVWQGKDYKISLAVLIKLVTKATIGLENVDNTSDAAKPLSQAMVQALSNKADKDSVPTNAQFQALSDSLQNYVTQTELNTAINGVMEALAQYSTKDEMAQAISTAIQPINQGLSQLALEVQQQSTLIAAIQQQQTQFATKTEVNAALQQQSAAFNTAITQAVTPLNQAVEQLQLSVTQMQQSIQEILLSQQQLVQDLANKADKVHTHTVDQVQGLDTYVQSLVEQLAAITLGAMEW